MRGEVAPRLGAAQMDRTLSLPAVWQLKTSSSLWEQWLGVVAAGASGRPPSGSMTCAIFLTTIGSPRCFSRSARVGFERGAAGCSQRRSYFGPARIVVRLFAGEVDAGLRPFEKGREVSFLRLRPCVHAPEADVEPTTLAGVARDDEGARAVQLHLAVVLFHDESVSNRLSRTFHLAFMNVPVAAVPYRSPPDINARPRGTDLERQPVLPINPITLPVRGRDPWVRNRWISVRRRAIRPSRAPSAVDTMHIPNPESASR